MSVATTIAAGYLGRRAAQKERVRILYGRALKDTPNWAVHRHLFYEDVPISNHSLILRSDVAAGE